MIVADKVIVTIGLCVKNAEATIKESADSIVVQDFPHELIEVIVVDGCSQDKTLSIIKKCLSKTAIKTRFFFENKGLGVARQMVIDNAKGDYIIWVDCDIKLSKDYVKRQVNFMNKHPSVGMATGIYGVCPEDNWVAVLENIGYVISRLRQKGKITSNLLSTSGSTFRVEAIRQLGGFDRNIKVAQEDTDVAYRMRDAGWLFYITNAVFYHRQRTTWKAIWNQHLLYGYGLHFILHKNKGQNAFIDRSVDRIPLSFLAYRLTHRKVVFLLPLNFVFKKAALLFGFAKAHLDGYGHKYATPKLPSKGAFK